MTKVVMVFMSVDFYRNLYGIKYFLQNRKIEKVYLLYNNLNNFFGKISKENTNRMEKKLHGLIEVKKVGINPEDFDECFSKLCKILKNEREKFT